MRLIESRKRSLCWRSPAIWRPTCSQRDSGIRRSGLPSAALHGEHLMHAGAFQVVEVVECPGHAGRDHRHPVAGRKQHILAVQCGCDPLAFGFVQCQATVFVVIADPVPESKGVLIAPFEPAILDQGQGGGIGHVGVQDAAGVRVQPVNPAVNEEGGRFQAMAAFEYLTGAVDQQDVGRGHFAPVKALRIDQVAVCRKFQAEVVADSFVEFQSCRPAQRRCKVDAALVGRRRADPDRRGVVPDGRRRVADCLMIGLVIGLRSAQHDVSPSFARLDLVHRQ